MGASTKSPPNLLDFFYPLRNCHGSGIRLVIWPHHIHIQFRIAQQYLRSCLNVYPNCIIQIEFLRFQQGLSVIGHVVVAQGYIAQVFDSTGYDFDLKITSFQSPSLTRKESVFRIINQRITVDSIWSCHHTSLKQILTKKKKNRVQIAVVSDSS